MSSVRYPCGASGKIVYTGGYGRKDNPPSAEHRGTGGDRALGPNPNRGSTFGGAGQDYQDGQPRLWDECDRPSGGADAAASAGVDQTLQRARGGGPERCAAQWPSRDVQCGGGVGRGGDRLNGTAGGRAAVRELDVGPAGDLPERGEGDRHQAQPDR